MAGERCRDEDQCLLSWDVDTCHVDFHSELNVIVESSPPGEELKGGERLIQFASDNLVVEVLINPQLYTLQQCMRNMLSSFTKHRHIIHGGYTFVGTGAWVLQDGAYPYHEFSHTFDEYDIQRVMRAYENSITINLHCCAEGEWSQERINKEQYTEFCQVKLNPPEVIQDMTVIESFLSYIGPFLVPQSTQQALPPSDVVGNIRFSHPTLYVFPGGQGDSALFGINGFNMLIDGGFSRKACFWDFSRHLDRLDAILITRLSNENTCGMSALLQRKTMSALYPQIGHVFANLPIKAQMQSSTTHPDKSGEGRSSQDADDNLLINVIEEGNFMLDNLRILNLKPQICFRERSCEPINLYHKVGHGKLDMYVVNPGKDAKELREFMERWNENSQTLGNFRSGINIDGKELWLPIANLVSICALVVWIPDDPNDTVTRLLFPGSTPQHKILRGLEKLKSLEFIQKRVCLSGSLPKAKPTSPAAKSSGYGKREMSSHRQSSVTSSKRVPRNVSSSREFGSDKLSERGERLESRHRRIRSESTTKQQIRTSREKMDVEKKQVPEVKEKRTKSSAAKKSEDKNLKEQKNQVAEAKLKENKKEANTAIKSRVVTKSTRPKVTEKSSITASGGPVSTTASSMNKSTTVSSVTRSSVTKSGASKLSKDASNKTKKAADTKSKRDAKPIRGGSGKISSAALAVGTTAAVGSSAAAAASTSRKISNEVPAGANKEDEQESIVEKHQIEEMEHEPVDHVDDIEPELERIKDEEDDAQDNVIREADIPTEELKEPTPKDSPPTALPLAMEKEAKTPLAHIKTPDEVDDLPEHEAVEPEAIEVQAEASNDQTEEEKITQDLQEKEQIQDVTEKSLDIPMVQDASLVAQTPESEGVQQQKDMSEIMVEHTNIEMRPQDQAENENEKEADAEESSSPFAQVKDAVENVKEFVAETFDSETKPSEHGTQDDTLAQNDKDKSLGQDLETISKAGIGKEIEETLIEEKQIDAFQSTPKNEAAEEQISNDIDPTKSQEQLAQPTKESDIRLTKETEDETNVDELSHDSKPDKEVGEHDAQPIPDQDDETSPKSTTMDENVTPEGIAFMPKDDNAGSKTPKDDGNGSKTPKDVHASGSKTPLDDERDNSEITEPKDIGSTSSKDDGAGSKIQKDSGTNSMTSKSDENLDSKTIEPK
ncbi:hypothetical protein TCAL_02318 [Tigriopus californicus]|uniref:Microtubule-associated protein futsch n=1 Tax=Tigriopus californicus TaxID=6832 RepID=A0A553NNI6_TIGCA|nr:hypothetical protein TCAL_02318 [Tigriopus californicus]